MKAYLIAKSQSKCFNDKVVSHILRKRIHLGKIEVKIYKD